MSNATQTDPIQSNRPTPNVCHSQHCPVWQWNATTFLRAPSSGHPPISEDPWLRDATEFLRQCRSGWSDANGESTEIQRVIGDALTGTTPSMMIAVQTASDAALLLWDDVLSPVRVPKEIRECAKSVKTKCARSWPVREALANATGLEQIVLASPPTVPFQDR